MRARLLFVFSLLVAGLVSACGGGGGGGSTPPVNTPTPVKSSTPSAGPTVAANPNGCAGADAATRSSGVHTQAVGIEPPANGVSATYQGTLAETIDTVSPCPIGTSTAAASVQIVASMTSATDEHDVETDAYATQTTQLTTDATVTSSPGPSSSLDYIESKEVSTDTVGDVLTTTYGLAPLIYGVASPVPYTVNGGTITNDPPSTVDDAFADGSSENRTYAADGSYSESDVLTGNPASTIQTNSDFSANYTIQTPLDSGAPNFVSAIQFSYSKPVSNSIALTIAYTATGPGAPTAPPAYPIQQWWPNTVTQQYTDVTTDAGTVTSLPTQCTPETSPASAEDFRRIITSVDPALGSYDVRTINSYVAKNYDGAVVAGPVCVVISDVQQLFYNYLFDTPYVFYFSQNGLPFQTDTIAESYWLTTAPSTLTKTRTQAVSMSDVPGLVSSIAAHNAGINFVRATQRTTRMEQFVKSIRSATTIKGVSIK